MDVVQKPDESCLLALMQQTDKKGCTRCLLFIIYWHLLHCTHI